MPLSEEEQRVLAEIERQLYESDPQLAEAVRSTTVYRDAGKSLRWAAFGLVLGFVLMVATFTSSLLLGFAGFLVMLGSAIMIERSLRRMGRAGWNTLSRSVRSGKFLETLERRRREARQGMRKNRRDQSS